VRTDLNHRDLLSILREMENYFREFYPTGNFFNIEHGASAKHGSYKQKSESGNFS